MKSAVCDLCAYASSQMTPDGLSVFAAVAFTYLTT